MKYEDFVDWDLTQHLHTADGRALLGYEELWLDLGALLEGPTEIRSALTGAGDLLIQTTIPHINHTTFHLDAFSPPAHLRYFFHRRIERPARTAKVKGADDFVWADLTVVDLLPQKAERRLYEGLILGGDFREGRNNEGITTMLITEMHGFELSTFTFQQLNELPKGNVDVDRIVVDITSRGEGYCK